MSRTPRPMLPAICVGRPACFRIWWISAVVVDLPFEPVMQIVRTSPFATPLSICADESLHTARDLESLVGRYSHVNVKLDKTGGLTEALALRQAALAEGYGVMVGCMVGSSLAMAPATLVAQAAAYVDLDGPLLLAQDRESPLTYADGKVYPPEPGLWG